MPQGIEIDTNFFEESPQNAPENKTESQPLPSPSEATASPMLPEIPLPDTPFLPELPNSFAIDNPNNHLLTETLSNEISNEVIPQDDLFSPQSSNTPYRNRTKEKRTEALRQYGGSSEVETAVLRALRWLKQNQNPDGSWAPSETPAITGLGLLAFLAHGETPSSAEFGNTVKEAMFYLTNLIENAQAPLPDYRNGIIAYALAEGYGFTQIPLLKKPAEKAIQWILEGQQDNGGFDYFYKKENRWDLSIACWQFQAIHAAILAKLDIPQMQNAMKKGCSFIRNVTWSPTRKRFGYTTPGKGTDGLQAAALYCLLLMKKGDSTEARITADFICESCRIKWPQTTEKSKKKGGMDNPLYAWYYQTQAMFHKGGHHWKEWNQTFSHEIIRHQQKDGSWKCPNAANKTVAYEAWYTTAMAALTLQVYYRYLPTSRK